MSQVSFYISHFHLNHSNVIDSTSIYVFYLQLGVVVGVVDLVHVGVLPYVGHQVGV